MNKKLRNYLIAFAVGLFITLLVALSKDAFGQTDMALTAQYLCDGCFIAAVALCGSGLLAFVASDGFFDMLSFGAKKMLMLLQRDNRKFSGSFYEYKLAKMANRGGFGFLIVSGSVFLALAVAFLLLYNRSA